MDLHTSSNNSFYGEPDMHIKENIQIEIVESFIRNKKGREAR